MSVRKTIGFITLTTGLLLAACGDDDAAAPPPADTTERLDTADTQEATDIEDSVEDTNEDVELPWDLGPDFEAIEREPDVEDIKPSGFDDCPTLGISPKWSGTFEGVVTYDLEDNDTGAPEKGLFFVEGDLEFEIQCLDQKLLVAGALNGSAEAAGEVGVHPFAANLFGDFNYIDRTINANIVDGEVRLFKVISVFFAGDFDGAVQPNGTFTGTWDCSHTGNDLNLDGEASGYGPWTATPSL